MELVMLLLYGAVYLAGYYGGHFVNLAVRRVLISNLRVCGLLVLIAFAVLMTLIIEASATAENSGFLFGYFILSPVVIVACCVAFRMWRENRQLGKVKKY